MAAAHVQAVSKTFANTTSAAALFGSAVTTGNLIVVQVSVTGAPTINTPTDTGSNTYTLIDTKTGGSTTTKTYYAKNVTGGGAFTVTVTLSAAQFGFIMVHEASGLDPTAPLDQHITNAQTNVGTAADAITSTAVTTTTAGQYIFGGTIDDSQGGFAVSAGTGYGTADLLPNDSGVNGASEHQIQSAAGAIAATFTTTTAASNWVTAIATFKAAAAAGGSKRLLVGVGR